MSARLLYGVLLIGSLAMLLFVAGFVLLHLGLGLLTTLFYAIAGRIMLLALCLLLLLGAAALFSALWRELAGYFCREAAALRRVLALQTQQQHSALRAAAEWRQIQYFHHFKRQRLLANNNRKHLKALFDAIHQELQAVKAQLPKDTYKTMCKALRNHHKRADSQAMLALRREIPCR